MVRLAGRGGYHMAAGRRTAVGRLALEELVSRLPDRAQRALRARARTSRPTTRTRAIEEFRRELRAVPDHYPSLAPDRASSRLAAATRRRRCPSPRRRPAWRPDVPAGAPRARPGRARAGRAERAVTELEKGAALAPESADVQFSPGPRVPAGGTRRRRRARPRRSSCGSTRRPKEREAAAGQRRPDRRHPPVPDTGRMIAMRTTTPDARRRVAAALLAWTTATTGLPASAARGRAGARARPSSRRRPPTVLLDLVVRDKKGKLVRDLTADGLRGLRGRRAARRSTPSGSWTRAAADEADAPAAAAAPPAAPAPAPAAAARPGAAGARAAPWSRSCSTGLSPDARKMAHEGRPDATPTAAHATDDLVGVFSSTSRCARSSRSRPTWRP